MERGRWEVQNFQLGSSAPGRRRMFLNCSTCFERHTAHNRELKNCNCSLWFYIRLWLPAADSCRQQQTYVKPEATITVFELLMMSGVSLETCWAIKKQWNNKLYYTVASCWLFLYDLYYDARIHEHDVPFCLLCPLRLGWLYTTLSSIFMVFFF